MLFGTTVGLELGLLLLYYRECLRCDVLFGTAVGMELYFLLLYYIEVLRCYLWSLVLGWDWNWA